MRCGTLVLTIGVIIILMSTAMAGDTSRYLREGDELHVVSFSRHTNGTVSFDVRGDHMFNLTVRTVYDDILFEQRGDQMDGGGGYALNYTFDYQGNITYSIWITNDYSGMNHIHANWTFFPSEEPFETGPFDTGDILFPPICFLIIAIQLGAAVVIIFILGAEMLSRRS